MLRGGRGWRSLRPDRLWGHWGPYKREGVREGNIFHSVRLGTRGRQGRRQLITRPPAVSGQIYAVTGPNMGGIFNAVSKYQQEASREKSIHHCFCGKLGDEKSIVKPCMRRWFVLVLCFYWRVCVSPAQRQGLGIAVYTLQAVNSSPHHLQQGSIWEHAAAVQDLTGTKKHGQRQGGWRTPRVKLAAVQLCVIKCSSP